MHKFSSHPDSLSGMVLAASPELLDPNFKQALIFIAEHNTEGAFGLVMSRPLGRPLGDVLAGPSTHPVLEKVPVLVGGPVRPEHLLLASFSEENGMYSCVTDRPPEEMAVHLAADNHKVLAFLGYAGWGEGQLEQELDAGAWTICTPEATLFDQALVPNLWSVYITGDDRWRDLLPHLPKDPSRN